jgi:hypothetical protein
MNTTVTESQAPKELAAPKNAQSGEAAITHLIRGGPWLVNGQPTTEVKVVAYPVTRWHVRQAMEEAALAFLEKYGKKGLSPTVFEDALARACIKSWTLPKPPSLNGWRLIEDKTLGDKIAEALGFDDALRSLRGESKEAEDAGNSQPGDSSPTSPPTS